MKYTVTTAYGTFKRTTQRTYTHLVIARGMNPETIINRYSREIPYAEKQIAEYEAAAAFSKANAGGGDVAEKGGTFHVCNSTDKWDIGFTAEEWLGYAAQQREVIATNAVRRDAELARNEAEGYGYIGWCGRVDLAVKQADAARKNGHRDVKIIVVATGYEL